MDKNSKRMVTKHLIAFDFNTEGTWLDHPDPQPDKVNPLNLVSDTVGLWKAGLKRPAADRFLTPKSSQDDKESSFSTAPAARCTDVKLEAFFAESQLLKASGNTKKLSLCRNFFEVNEIEFKESQLFSVIDNHARKNLAVQGAMHQIVNDLKEYMIFLTSNWNLTVDLDGNTTDTVLHESLPEGFLFDLIKDFRAALELLSGGGQTSIDWGMASIVASRCEGRKKVLARCYGDPLSKNTKSDLLNSGYSGTQLFGPMPESDTCRLVNDAHKKGQLLVRVKESASGQGASTSGLGSVTSNSWKRKNQFPDLPANRRNPFPNNPHRGGRGRRGARGGRGGRPSKNNYQNAKLSKNAKRGKGA